MWHNATIFKSQSERTLSTPESHHSFGTVSHVTFIRPLIGCLFCYGCIRTLGYSRVLYSLHSWDAPPSLLLLPQELNTIEKPDPAVVTTALLSLPILPPLVSVCSGGPTTHSHTPHLPSSAVAINVNSVHHSEGKHRSVLASIAVFSLCASVCSYLLMPAAAGAERSAQTRSSRRNNSFSQPAVPSTSCKCL